MKGIHCNDFVRLGSQLPKIKVRDPNATERQSEGPLVQKPNKKNKNKKQTNKFNHI